MGRETGYVVVGTLSDDLQARVKEAENIKTNAQATMGMAVEAAMSAAVVKLEESRKLMSAIWDDIYIELGIPEGQRDHGRFGLNVLPDGTVRVVDVEATHKLNCPVHEVQADGEGKGN